MFVFLILGAVIGALSVVFFLQNTTVISVMFLSWEIESSLAVILAIAFVGGIVMTLLFSLPSLISDWLEGARIERRVRQLEDELREARAREAAAKIEAEKAKSTPFSPVEHLA